MLKKGFLCFPSPEYAFIFCYSIRFYCKPFLRRASSPNTTCTQYQQSQSALPDNLHCLSTSWTVIQFMFSPSILSYRLCCFIWHLSFDISYFKKSKWTVYQSLVMFFFLFFLSITSPQHKISNSNQQEYERWFRSSSTKVTSILYYAHTDFNDL